MRSTPSAAVTPSRRALSSESISIYVPAAGVPVPFTARMILAAVASALAPRDTSAGRVAVPRATRLSLTPCTTM